MHEASSYMGDAGPKNYDIRRDINGLESLQALGRTGSQ
jgi:hypothetical protein